MKLEEALELSQKCDGIPLIRQCMGKGCGIWLDEKSEVIADAIQHTRTRVLEVLISHGLCQKCFDEGKGFIDGDGSALDSDK